MADDQLPDPVARELALWRDEFAGRRTVPGQMLDRAEQLVRISIDYHDRLAAAARATVEEEAEHLVAVARAESASYAARIADLEAQRAELIAALEQATEDRKLREERAAFGEMVTVRIDAEGARDNIFTVAELEEFAYRFRVGGATDDTEVMIKGGAAQALVPAPNLVQLHREKPSAVVYLPAPPAPTGVSAGKVYGMVGAVLAVIAMLAVLDVVGVL